MAAAVARRLFSPSTAFRSFLFNNQFSSFLRRRSSPALQGLLRPADASSSLLLGDPARVMVRRTRGYG
jgi:hypothetical protein